MIDKIISLLQKKQDRLSRRYEKLEDAQGECPHAYSDIQSEMQLTDEINEHYRRAVYNLEMAARLESGVIT